MALLGSPARVGASPFGLPRALRSVHGARGFLLGGSLVLLAGCALLDAFGAGSKRFAFSHREHVVEQELGCTDCHLDAETAARPSIPGVGACRLCHEELDSEKPAERKVEALYDGKEFRAAHRGALGEGMRFDHARHVEAGFDCAECHADLEHNEDASVLGPTRMATCTKCHEDHGATGECASCHPGIERDVPPPSHAGQWQRLHGSACRRGAERTADDCALCHSESSCTSCHATTMPESHTNQWRRFGHGMQAALDRSSCMVCHRSDSCSQCHAENKPRSHVGAFGGTQSQHCVSCHFPLGSEGCATCHASAPSHALAAPKPAGHTSAMNCRQCHGVPGGPPLPHVDNGDNCNICHH